MFIWSRPKYTLWLGHTEVSEMQSQRIHPLLYPTPCSRQAGRRPIPLIPSYGLASSDRQLRQSAHLSTAFHLPKIRG